jgi:hypothetical protein
MEKYSQNLAGHFRMCGAIDMKNFRFSFCDCLQVTAHHAAYPENVSWDFQDKCYYQINEDNSCTQVAVDRYSCGCEECEEIV